ncbi:nucleotidyl transferase AbiEii/AbiGii toxin family protein [Enterococcus timonensis]|uniref:nucleotidyl transferase AbiEii/AbiGii toxin family protein n=1 Tax=Enterococcus timonensis TaxID=1852364 RepID=UPI0008D8E03F|nr:nucleotidyl transferase AbiEii/AbiGii toxin family protein [Enterococcus timonensis]
MINPDKMKNLIRKKSKEYQIAPQQLYSLFGLEQLLIKIEQSPFKDHFILKGGFLLSTVYGLENRSTMDLDATVQNLSLNNHFINRFTEFINAPDADGNSYFTVKKIKENRHDFIYPGYNLKLDFEIGTVKIPLDLDFTTGETLLPTPKTTIPLLFSDKTVRFPAYPQEQILADKIFTTLAYGSYDDQNSRAKDLYDIYFLHKFQSNMDYSLVRKAIAVANKQRNIDLKIESFPGIISQLEQSKHQQQLWQDFQKNHFYAANISFRSVFTEIKSALRAIFPK